MLLTLDDVSVQHDRRRAPLIEHLCGTLFEGDMLAIVGPNGVGKTSLLQTLVGLMRPRQGRLIWHTGAPPRRAYLPQRTSIDRSLPISVVDFVALGLWPHVGAWRRCHGVPWDDLVCEALESVGLMPWLNANAHDLSAGQFQRLRWARISLMDAPLILLDEPFTGIDEDTTHELCCHLKTWHRQGRTIITVLHDLACVEQHFPRRLVLTPGRGIWFCADTPSAAPQRCRPASLKATQHHALGATPVPTAL